MGLSQDEKKPKQNYIKEKIKKSLWPIYNTQTKKTVTIMIEN
jgi:hypothetical protein